MFSQVIAIITIIIGASSSPFSFENGARLGTTEHRLEGEGGRPRKAVSIKHGGEGSKNSFGRRSGGNRVLVDGG